VHATVRAGYRAVGSVAAALATVAPAGARSKWVRTLAARRGVLARMAQWAASHRDRTRPLLWVHAASVGEGLQARAVLERVRHLRADVQIAYTHFSPSAEGFAESLVRAGVADVADYLPFDTVAAADALLDALAPTALVFAKLDVWPMLVERAAARGVHLGMVSATVRARSGRRAPLAATLLRDAYAKLAAVGAIADADADRLVALGVPSGGITITGDARYDQVWSRAHTALAAAHTLLPASQSPDWARRPTIVAGSTWPPDEVVVLEAWDPTQSRLIIAPHEPTETHLKSLERWAHAHSIRCVRLSRSTSMSEKEVAAPAILVDTVGVLADLYAIADIAYVGGGFHRAGLHSVLEPAACGVPIVFGPRADSRDADLLLTARAAHTVRTSAELATRLLTWITRSDARRAAGVRARDVVAHGLGAADTSAALVAAML
jgi:3-deoxy-D-manno-octulosonic-acid transferase